MGDQLVGVSPETEKLIPKGGKHVELLVPQGRRTISNNNPISKVVCKGNPNFENV